MILKLRRKFIIILMSVVTCILLGVFIAMLASTAENSRHMSESLLRQAIMMHERPQVTMPPQAEGEPGGASPPGSRTPVIVAAVDAGGNIIFLNDELLLLDEEQAVAAIREIAQTDKTAGTLAEHDLRWLKSDTGRYIALVDISVEKQLLKNLILNSLMIGAAALAVFFLVSVFLSRWAVRPAALAWERQRQFVADASHELKTPLTVILSNAEMIKANNIAMDTKTARRVGHIQAEAVRMKKLVEDLLTLAKSDEAAGLRAKERVDYSFIIKNILLTFEPIAFDEGKKLRYDVREGLFVSGDAQRLRQLAAILLDNAVKFCTPGGQITLQLRAGERKTAHLVVTNEGEPIPEEQLKKIFRRFYQADKARSAHNSFGLGLSIAESIVKEHGGKIWAENDAEKGNSFFVIFPQCC